MSVFSHLREDKQAALLTYFDDEEQDWLNSKNIECLSAHDPDGTLTLREVGVGYLQSDTTCAAIVDGDGR